jgi:O-antigen/teichoic acid export membrane protein
VYAGLCALALAINVALNASLIPLRSIEGAAWATLGTEIVLTAGCGLALWMIRARLRQAFGAAGREDASLATEA